MDPDTDGEETPAATVEDDQIKGNNDVKKDPSLPLLPPISPPRSEGLLDEIPEDDISSDESYKVERRSRRNRKPTKRLTYDKFGNPSYENVSVPKKK